MAFDPSDPNTKEMVVSYRVRGGVIYICGTGQGLSLFMDSVSGEVGVKAKRGKKQVGCSLLDLLKVEVCYRMLKARVCCHSGLVLFREFLFRT